MTDLKRRWRQWRLRRANDKLARATEKATAAVRLVAEAHKALPPDVRAYLAQEEEEQ